MNRVLLEYAYLLSFICLQGTAYSKHNTYWSVPKVICLFAWFDYLRPINNQIWYVSYSHKWDIQRQTFFGPWGPGEGSKCQISFSFNYKVNFKDFFTKLCVCSHKWKIQNISDGIFILLPGSCPRGGTLGCWRCPGGLNTELILKTFTHAFLANFYGRMPFLSPTGTLSVVHGSTCTLLTKACFPPAAVWISNWLFDIQNRALKVLILKTWY